MSVSTQVQHNISPASGQIRRLEKFKWGYIASLAVLVLLVVVADVSALLRPDTAMLFESSMAASILFVLAVQAIFLFGPAWRDVKLQMEALASARKHADGAADSKAAFLANMSHEIRTPMTAIVGYADLMLDPVQTQSERVDCLQAIRRNGEHLLKLIDDILDHSKIEAGQMKIEPIDCSPLEVISDVISMMHVRAVGKGLTLDVRRVLPLPATIHTDPSRLRQVLINLLGNAIKFTDRGTVTLTISLDTIGEEPVMKFEVIDTGVGINAEQLAGLFKPFAQGDPSINRRFGGTGLGLTISKVLVEMLGGAMNVESNPGRGSRFWFTIPTGDLSNVEMIDEPLQISEVRGSASNKDHSSAIELDARILLAEDGIDNQRLIGFHLRRAGATIDIAADGVEAVRIALAAEARGKPFDLILMDMQMPELDGYGAASQLRSRGYKRPIIALTAHAMNGDREKCLAAGCDDYLTKPIEVKKLLRTCADYTERRVERKSQIAGGQ